MTVYEAAQESRLAALRATRDALASAIDAGGGTVAQNAAQFRAVLAEIEEIEEIEKASAGQKGTALDEVNARRAAKAATSAARAARS